MTTKLRYCEFPGDSEHDWDEVGYKGRCVHAGFEHCTLHKEDLGSYQGWRVCSKSCKTPFYTTK